jgi:protein SCO1/2
MSFKYRAKRFLILSALGLTLGAGIAGLSILMENQGAGNKPYAPMVAPNIGGAFTLVNQDGKTVTEKDFANKYLLIYFGFASCPAICPTELQKITEAYQALPKPWQERIQPLFITIDPERDTPAILKNYVALFMPQLIGLTGSVEQIEAVKKAYKVYGAKVPEGNSYTMDHSSFIYFMGLGGKPLAMFKASDTADTITKTIPTLDGLD